MAHWAQLNEENKVIQIIVTDNAGDEGEQWLLDTFGGTWIKTSYNANIRGKYAGIGDTYDFELDIFIAPKFIPAKIIDEVIDETTPE